MRRTFHGVAWEREKKSGDWLFTDAYGARWRAVAGTDSGGRTVAFTLERDGEFVREGKHRLFVEGTLKQLAKNVARRLEERRERTTTLTVEVGASRPLTPKEVADLEQALMVCAKQHMMKLPDAYETHARVDRED